MKILKVIHGYPLRYNAGSEVYSQTLCQALADDHEVHVFTREENPFEEDFNLRQERDPDDDRICLHLINIPSEKFRYRYQHQEVDAQFAALLEHLKPDIVHIGHLCHLSTSILPVIAKKKIPIIYTLHDYWLMCPRGQFLQRCSSTESELWQLCDGQDDRKCARQCYSGCYSGADAELKLDENYWTDWVHRRMSHIRDIMPLVDYFIAPSQYLLKRYYRDFGLPRDKLIYLDYGFHRTRFHSRKRVPDESFTFGYIGTHIPAKGIQHLIQAFSLLKGDCSLRIWGRHRPQSTEGLIALAKGCDTKKNTRIEWKGEYKNQNITSDVFNHVDSIVVPSIWVENSPLVIHEALEAQVLVITANAGGMAEYIQHEVNGLLFEHRNPNDLAKQMQYALDHPQIIQKLRCKGYLQSKDGKISGLEDHKQAIIEIYQRVVA